jgi:hypothetical protein
VPRRCTICTSEDRPAIEQGVRNGEPYRVAALKYRVSYSALQRHVAGHMAAEDTLQQAVKVRLEDVVNLPANMAERRALVEALLDRCLEPLMRPGGSIDEVPLSVVVRLLKLQQTDEITVLRVNGFMLDQGNDRTKKADVKDSVVETEMYDRIMKWIDDFFQNGLEAGGDPQTR